MPHKALIGSDVKKKPAPKRKRGGVGRRVVGKPKKPDRKPKPVERKPKPVERKTLGPTMEEIAIERLKPAPYNPRKSLKPGDPAYDRLVASLLKNDLVDPIVWNKRTGNIVGGHQRFTVIRDKYPTVTHLRVSVVDRSLEDEKSLNVALNKITGEWDHGRLLVLLSEQESTGRLHDTGYTDVEFKTMLAQHEAAAKDEAADTSPSPDLKEYLVVVFCTDKHHQAGLIARMKKEGFQCQRSLVS